LEYYTLGTNLFKELHSSNLKNIDLLKGLGGSYIKLGFIYGEMRKKYLALENFQKAFDIFSNIYQQTNIEEYKNWADMMQDIINDLKKTYAQRIKEVKEKIDEFRGIEQINGARQMVATLYGNLSWYYLFERQFVQAEKAARKALELDSTQQWVNTNLAHALLFQGKFDEAKKIYLSMKDKVYEEDETKKYKDIFLADLKELEEAGITNKDVEKIRKLLEK
jgi:tetratricopeptide (TPR) repeat protein